MNQAEANDFRTRAGKRGKAIKNNTFSIIIRFVHIPTVSTPASTRPFMAPTNPFVAFEVAAFITVKRVQKVLISLVKIHHGDKACEL